MEPTPPTPAPQEAVARVRCWQCGTTNVPSLFCLTCDAIQALAAQTDYFRILGIERRLDLDLDHLQRRYFDLSRRLHPDVHLRGPAQARIASLGNTAMLNRAYRTLRDPVERGIYWLGLHGETLGGKNHRVPPDLAALVFEVQEKLEVLRQQDGAASALRDEIRRIRATLEDQRQAHLAALARNFARWDTRAADTAALTQELKAALSAIKYLRTLMRDVDKELER
ncbi:MAG: Fe-S protein assembly co-chaperone HscB [Deltaproteobacteria bacterium]|nr:Fe-S protein assembly co-chaperone HscB [Deltaproteobacteria bacterium]